ncbi:RidA family protein [Pusillimonas noertemannii]|uniref:RidA family protein n=1 Tax=Pusillimonas noertemannii TaxID=305977 RepID=UPI00333E86F4
MKQPNMRLIDNPTNPPAGHYSPAVVCNGFVFLSGVLPATRQPDDFKAEVGQVLEQSKKILARSGCGLADVVQCTAYIVGTGNWPAFNEVYASFFEQHKPARTVVPVPELHHGSLVEIQMIAALPTA